MDSGHERRQCRQWPSSFSFSAATTDLNIIAAANEKKEPTNPAAMSGTFVCTHYTWIYCEHKKLNSMRRTYTALSMPMKVAQNTFRWLRFTELCRVSQYSRWTTRRTNNNNKKNQFRCRCCFQHSHSHSGRREVETIIQPTNLFIASNARVQRRIKQSNKCHNKAIW